MEHFIGTIRMVVCDFAPEGWLFCHGQMLKVHENQALFSIINNRYGGDGKHEFALPDFRGRFLMGTGQGNGLSSHHIGASGGQESVTIPTEYVRVGSPGETGYGGIKLRVTNEALTVSTIPPFCSINFIIAVTGEYPVRPD